MEHTKGELKRETTQSVPAAVMGDGKTTIVILGDTTLEKAEANLKEVFRRWNAFEKDGLVELCQDLKARLSMYEGRHRSQCSLGDECPDKKLLKKAEAAIAKAKA